MFKILKRLFDDIKELDDAITSDNCNDVSVEIAKNNYSKYQRLLEEQRQEYKKELCKQIKDSSKRGNLSTMTLNLHDEDFMNYNFLMELKEYFEERGFEVKEESSNYGLLTTWLRISWE